jgi:hypothetical protein
MHAGPHLPDPLGQCLGSGLQKRIETRFKEVILNDLDIPEKIETIDLSNKY